METTTRSKWIAFGARAAVAVVALGCATQSSSAQAQPMRSQVGPYELEVLTEGSQARSFFHGGETYVMGHMGTRYTLRVHNRSGQRVEAVVSVDGRDVVDGKSADVRNKRGYLVPAWSFVDIEGWRLSTREVAAFRFTSVPDSYAGRMGNARNVGVIGVAVFPERVAYRPRPQPVIPYRTYPSHPHYGRDDAREEDFRGYGSSGGAPSAKSGAAPEGGVGSARAEAPSDKAQAAPAPPASRSADGALADSESKRSRSVSPYRPGLGTEFGESHSSHIREVTFVRANSAFPAAVLGARYNDRSGLLAIGIDVDGYPHYGHDDAYLRGTANPFPVSHRPYAAPPSGWRR